MLMTKRAPASVAVAAAISLYSAFAVSEEVPYDYYHATSCFAHGLDISQLPDRRMELHPALGYIEVPQGQSGWIFCPIVRVYPRHAGRLLQVVVDLDFPLAGKSRTVSVCASRMMDVSDTPHCESQNVSGVGKKRVTLRRPILSTEAGLSWDHYLFIVMYLEGGDRIYGYRTDFNLK